MTGRIFRFLEKALPLSPRCGGVILNALGEKRKILLWGVMKNINDGEVFARLGNTGVQYAVGWAALTLLLENNMESSILGP